MAGVQVAIDGKAKTMKADKSAAPMFIIDDNGRAHVDFGLESPQHKRRKTVAATPAPRVLNTPARTEESQKVAHALRQYLHDMQHVVDLYADDADVEMTEASTDASTPASETPSSNLLVDAEEKPKTAEMTKRQLGRHNLHREMLRDDARAYWARPLEKNLGARYDLSAPKPVSRDTVQDLRMRGHQEPGKQARASMPQETVLLDIQLTKMLGNVFN